MDFSWRAKRALAVAFSDDGINWSEPSITLGADKTSGWEDRVNSNCVLKIGDRYKMWYTGQALSLIHIFKGKWRWIIL